jgi:hypothetical protein
MSLIVDSQCNHPITLNLVSAGGLQKSSLHLAPFQKRVVIDDMYKNSRDVVNGLRTRKLSVSFQNSQEAPALHSKSVEEEKVHDVELSKPKEGAK